MTFSPFAAGGLTLQAATPAAGVALVNGTPGILSWSVPNDGQQHRMVIVGSVVVTSLQTGGNLNISWTPPGGGGAHNAACFTGGQAAGTYGFNSLTSQEAIVGPGTTVTVTQSSAQTGGAATTWAEIWGS